MSVLWVRQRDTGYRHFSLVFSLWQGLCYMSGVCLCRFWCQSKQTCKTVIRTGQSQGINTSIHPSPHMNIKTLKNMQVQTQACAYTHLGIHTKEPTDVHSGHSNPESSSWFLNIWSPPCCMLKCERLNLWKLCFTHCQETNVNKCSPTRSLTSTWRKHRLSVYLGQTNDVGCYSRPLPWSLLA